MGLEVDRYQYPSDIFETFFFWSRFKRPHLSAIFTTPWCQKFEWSTNCRLPTRKPAQLSSTMASTSCCRCLLRPSVTSTALGFSGNASTHLPSLTKASFSTSQPLAATPPKKPKGSAAVQLAKKSGKTLKIKKKAFVQTGRPPAPGERKAIRKRIVLSNTNALEVPGLVDLTPEALLDSASIGKVLGLPGIVVDQLRAVEAFKTTQGWGMFRRPAVLIRTETVEIAKMMHDAEEGKKTALRVLDGERVTGKSMMLLQAMAAAFSKGWIVINIPEGKSYLVFYTFNIAQNLTWSIAQELVNSNTEYAPIPGTTPTSYSQNTYTANWLNQIGKGNAAILSELQLTQKHTLPIPLQPNISLARLVELGARDTGIAWPVFQAFWAEITAAGAPGRPPVLLTLDGLSHVTCDSAYRDPDFNLINARDLAIVAFFFEYLSGAKKLPNGGAVLAATSKGNAPLSYALSIAIRQQEERQAGIPAEKITQPEPYRLLDQRAFQSLQAAPVLRVNGLSKLEARGLMEYWAASGMLRKRVDEKTVTEKWTISGHGVVGEMERGALMRL